MGDAGGEEGSRCNYPTRFDTYGCGCEHDCNYCYARSLLDFRGLWHPDEPHVADLSKIEKRLDRIAPGTVLRVGGMTDCFAPIEERKGVTYQTLKMMFARGIHALIVTKSDLIASDKYMAILDPDLAHIQISITSTSDEPNALGEHAAPPSRRMRAAETLCEAGFDVAARLSPFIPEFMDTDALNALKVDKAIVEFLRVNGWVRRWLRIDYRPYTLKEGGYRHLPLKRKVAILKQLEFPRLSVCEDVASHYRYWQRAINANPKDCCDLRLENAAERKAA